MAKKTGMSSSSLWIITIVLLALAAWTYFKR
jgi:LPXTG-motif cell wall-anchored protein